MGKTIIILSLLFLSVYARRTCKTFDTQAEAQRYFDARMPYWKSLDGDKDGEACECLLGGSSYDKWFCRKWRAKYRKK